MGHQNDGAPPRVHVHQAHHPGAGVLVQPLVGLVQGQNIIFRQQGTTQGHPALHSAAERGYRLRKAFGGNTQLKQQLPGLRDGRTGRQTHVRRSGQPVQKPVLLKYGAEARALRDANLTAVGSFQPHQKAEQGGFAATRRAHQAGMAAWHKPR